MNKFFLTLFTIQLIFSPLITLSQLTYVPDDNFEQELINLGLDNVLDNYVYTSNLNSISSLYLQNKNISDLTGIEDFTNLTVL